jgi:hypothetical protein
MAPQGSDVLGLRVIDEISGFRGLAISQTRYLHGCDRVAVQARAIETEGEMKPGVVEVFDLLSLTVLNSPPYRPPVDQITGG